jgi:hypothetical protein
MLFGSDHMILLRIVDGAEKPIQNVTAIMIKWSRSGEVEKVSQGTTDQKGLIIFHLSDPLPERIGFSFSPDELKYCSDLAFPTEGILNSGWLGENKCKPEKGGSQFSPKPGEITIFAKRVSFWDRLRREVP